MHTKNWIEEKVTGLRATAKSAHGNYSIWLKSGRARAAVLNKSSNVKCRFATGGEPWSAAWKSDMLTYPPATVISTALFFQKPHPHQSLYLPALSHNAHSPGLALPLPLHPNRKEWMLTFGLWDGLNARALVYRHCGHSSFFLFPFSVSPGRNWMIVVPLKKAATDPVELPWERDASVAEKTRVWVVLCCTANIPAPSQWPLCVRVLCTKHANNWIPLTLVKKEKNLCFLIKSVIYYFLWPTMHHSEGDATRGRPNQSEREEREDSFTNTSQFHFCTPRSCHHCLSLCRWLNQ